MVRLPAEWEKQEMILMAFPHKNTDWNDDLKSAYTTFVKLASAICFNQKLIILVPKEDREKIKEMFCYHDRISFVSCKTNDTWIRDFGPICVYEDNKRVIKDFLFNGWGGKFEYQKDNSATKCLHKGWHFGISLLKEIDFILEGGSIETDGMGTILTTTKCLLNPNRNNLSKEQIEEVLKKEFGVNRILWLEHGYLAGDDTDSHIDMLARFISEDKIVYVKCEDRDDEHFYELSKMEEELKSFLTKDNKPYTLIPLPMPKAIYKDGKRLPATYANFLITNHSVILPIYQDDKDRDVIALFKELFPNKEIIPLDSTRLIEQGGAIHCSTMQVPVQMEVE